VAIKLVFKLIFFIAIGQLVGCATHIEKEHNTPPPIAKQFSAVAIREPKPSGPYIAQLHQLLIAEFAGYQEHYQTSAEYYYEVARQSRDPKVARRALEIALAAKQTTLALQVARLWVELEPDEPDAHQYLISALLQEDQADEALREIDRLFEQLQALPDQRLLFLLRTIAQHENQKVALQIMDKIAAKRPNDPDVLLIQARLLLFAKRIEDAERVLAKALKLEPSNAQTLHIYLQVLLQMQHIDQALDLARNTVSKFPQQTQWRLLYAQLLLEAEKNDQALQQFQKLCAAEPENVEWLMMTASLAIKMQRWAQAEQYLHRLLKLNQEVNAAHYFLGQIAEAQKKWKKAAQWYEKIDQGDYSFNAKIRIVSMLLEQGKGEKALQRLRQISADNDEEQSAQINMEAQMLKELGRGDEALQVYDRYLQEESENVDILYERALIAESLGRLDIMERDLRKVIELNPDNMEAKNSLGYILADKTERYTEALALIQAAFDKNPDAYHIQDSMGWVLYRLKKYEESLHYLRQAYAQNQDPEIAAHLVEVLWVTGKKQQAKTIGKKAQQQYPTHEKLNEVMQQILRP